MGEQILNFETDFEDLPTKDFFLQTIKSQVCKEKVKNKGKNSHLMQSCAGS